MLSFDWHPKLMKTCEHPGTGFEWMMKYSRRENEPCCGPAFSVQRSGARPTLCESITIYDPIPSCYVLENFCNVQVTLHPKEAGCNNFTSHPLAATTWFGKVGTDSGHDSFFHLFLHMWHGTDQQLASLVTVSSPHIT